MTEDQIKHMANRFLQWRLPQNFNPDCGISYTVPNHPAYQDGTMGPMGTNLFDYTQAEVMVRHLVEGMSAASDNPDEAYELGKVDGYEKAVQDIDLMTGGDGEYRYCMGDLGSERDCPDAETMKARIADRFAPPPPEAQPGAVREDDEGFDDRGFWLGESIAAIEAMEDEMYANEATPAPIEPSEAEAREVLQTFASDVEDVQSRYIIVHQLRASADIQDSETQRRRGWATTSDRAMLMRKAADTIEMLAFASTRPSTKGDRDDVSRTAAAVIPTVRGVGRMIDNEKALLVMLDRKPTDDELRAIHDHLAATRPAATVERSHPSVSEYLTVPRLPEGCDLFAVNCKTGAWHYRNHADTWQGMPNPLTALQGDKS